MASIKRENMGLLNDKLTVHLTPADYIGGFETILKKHAKTANIPGFRKGMVPAGLIKKMYGQSVFTDEVLKKVEAELNKYLAAEKIEIFAQPLPLDSQLANMDFNQPTDYDFSFEIGLKPSFEIKTKDIKVKRYQVKVTPEMIQNEVERIQTRQGKMTEPETAESEDNVLNVSFIESDKEGNEIEGGIKKDNSLLIKYFAAATRKKLIGSKKDDAQIIQLKKAFEDKELEVIIGDLGITKEQSDKYFNLVITKVGLVEKANLDEALFLASYPNQEIKTEDEFRAAIQKDIEGYYEQQARNQIHDQIYHSLIEHTKMEFPTAFLKRWLQQGGEKQRTLEEAEKEYPVFQDQLKWTLISGQLMTAQKIEVVAEDLKDFAKQQLMSYMGNQMGAMGDNDKWLEDYAVRMMQDKKFVEDSYHRISTDKLFKAIETEVQTKDEPNEAEKFADMLNKHQH
ncbi:MAG: trigger factor [Bacteroidetes bacterium]|nr:trigger factor [Bacteroidota bacterium]